VKNAASLTRQLLGFAKGGLYEIKPIDLNPVIGKTLHLFGRTHKEIKIQRQFEKELWTVEVDQSQIEQVLLNLFVNAWQAMQEVGQITLTTANETLDEPFVKPYGLAPGRYVKITVRDTGPGIPREIQSKIFDPFFTTKEMGRGTGLGLASAYGIIKNHNGIIKVASEVGAGAEFRIYLPASEKKAGSEPPPIQGFYKGRETILLVEDEVEVMEVSVALLEKLGYRVFRAESGAKAIEIFHEKGEQIDLVILDIIMPEMAGTETFLRLRKLNPNVKILLASGYSAGAWNGQETPLGHNGFIQKPFRLQELSRKIREILDS
jgi:CheY-like chemotaxis protein